ncbi:MAG: hypothetical protein ACE5G7_04255, partial [Candidatus Hydrothermarchaeaceae archaeon]
MNQKQLASLLAVALIGIVLFSGYVRQTREEATTTTGEKRYVGDWADVELTDVATGERFRIRDFKGKPILVESFAVWCTTCLEQQRKIKELKEREGEAII